MAYSTLNLYRVNFNNETNAYIDDLDEYLKSVSKFHIDNFQYIRHNLQLTIKVNMDQDNIGNFYFNYVSIQNSILYGENPTYYYFIIGTKQISQECIELNL